MIVKQNIMKQNIRNKHSTQKRVNLVIRAYDCSNDSIRCIHILCCFEKRGHIL